MVSKHHSKRRRKKSLLEKYNASYQINATQKDISYATYTHFRSLESFPENAINLQYSKFITLVYKLIAITQLTKYKELL